LRGFIRAYFTRESFSCFSTTCPHSLHRKKGFEVYQITGVNRGFFFSPQTSLLVITTKLIDKKSLFNEPCCFSKVKNPTIGSKI